MRGSQQLQGNLQTQRNYAGKTVLSEFHRSLVNILPVAAVYITQDGRIVFQNGRMSSLIVSSVPDAGHGSATIDHLKNLLLPSSWERCEPLLSAAFKGVPAEATGPFRTRSGALLCHSISCLSFVTLSAGLEVALMQFALKDARHVVSHRSRSIGQAEAASQHTALAAGEGLQMSQAFADQASETILRHFPDDVLLLNGEESLEEKAHLLSEKLGGGHEPVLIGQLRSSAGSALPQSVYLPETQRSEATAFNTDRSMSEVRLVPLPYAGLAEPDNWPVLAVIRRNVDCPQEVAEYKRLAYQDPLTGLANRRSFTKSLKRELARLSAREEIGLAVIYIDLDEFKKVNDLGGHDAGDEMLLRVASSLTMSAGEFGTIARIGGDEFAGMMPVATEEAAEQVAADLLEGLGRIRLEVADRVFTISASLGVAFVEGGLKHCMEDPGALLKLADNACLRGKRFGGHSVQVHTLLPGECRAEGGSWREWPDPQNFRTNDLSLYAMPIVDLRTRKVLGREVLLRIQGTRTLGFSSRAWISAAERSGFIAQVDTWTLDRILDVAEEAETPDLLTMNISAGSAKDRTFRDRLFVRLCSNPHLASQLCLEVSEKDLLREPAAVESFLELVTSLGCKTAIDDFAGHWPVLSRLSRLPVEWLKLDAGLTQQLFEEPAKATILKGLVQTAKDLGISVIAKRVETNQEAELLKDVGLEAALGFFFGKPEPWPAGE